MPEPPALLPIDPSLVALREPEASVLANQIALGADPGTLDPDTRLLVTNLETGNRTTGTADAVGGFRIDLTAIPGDVLRVEADVNGGRTPPTDLVFTGDALSPFVLPACLIPVPDTYVVVEETTLVGIESACDDPLTVLGSVLLVDDGSFSADGEASPTSPVEVAPGGEYTLEVTPMAVTDDGDVLRFDVELAGETHLLAVSLRAR